MKDLGFTHSLDITKCSIFDDTDLPKTGKTMENISKIFHYASKIFYLGLKLFLSGY